MPAPRAARARADGAKACTSTTPSSTASASRSAPGATAAARTARRQSGAASDANRLGTPASRSPQREGSPANRTVPPGASTRANSANARSRSGMWWSTACPSTRSKLSSGKGRRSASAASVRTSTPSLWAFACSVSSIPRAPDRDRPDAVTQAQYVQRDQPVGVPPLELTGERTLPDVPAENYWFQRHLAVYEWVAARVRGRRVIDMACGEGYGSAVLARV